MQNAHPEIYTQFLTNILIISILLGFIVFLTLLYQKRKLQQKKEMELLKAETEKEIITTRLEIQEDILREISMEIHDNVGQTLLLTNVNLSILQKQLEKDMDAKNMMVEIKSLLSKSMEDLTSLSRSMNPDRISELGVFQVIQKELESLHKKGLFEVTIEMDTVEILKLQLSPELQILLYRIYQELIKNIIKHAAATKISLIMISKSTGLSIILSDNGKGFDNTEIKHVTGIGLKNIEKRIGIFNGKLTIDTKKGTGTSFEIFIPEEEIYK